MRPARFGALLTTLAASIVIMLATARPGHTAPTWEGQTAPREACKKALAREESTGALYFSRKPCDAAFLGGTTEDMRDEVASLMSPAAHPSLDDLALATLMSDGTVRKGRQEPWGYLSRCDIGRRLGSADLLASCVEDIRQVAPHHEALTQALAMAAERPSIGVQSFRLLLVLGLGVTLVSAAWTRLTRSRRRRAAAVASLAAVLLFLTAGGGVASAQIKTLPKKDHLSALPIDDADPESSVPGPDEAVKQPLQFGYLIQDLAARAEAASKRGDHLAAARYYGALAKTGPTMAYPPRKMCVELEAAGDLPLAVQACRSAISRLASTEEDYTRFVQLVLAQKDPLPAGERKELDAVINHLATDLKRDDVVPTILRCEVDLRYRDVPALEACTAELAQKAPKDPKTISLQWALAVERRDHASAESLLDSARGVGMGADSLARMEAATRAMRRRQVGRFSFLAISAVVIGIGFLIGRLWIAARREPAV